MAGDGGQAQAPGAGTAHSHTQCRHGTLTHAHARASGRGRMLRIGIDSKRSFRSDDGSWAPPAIGAAPRLRRMRRNAAAEVAATGRRPRHAAEWPPQGGARPDRGLGLALGWVLHVAGVPRNWTEYCYSLEREVKSVSTIIVTPWLRLS